MRKLVVVLAQTIVCSAVACSPPVGALDSKNSDAAFWRRIRYNSDAEREVTEKITDARVNHGVRPLVWLSLSCQAASQSGLQFVLYEDNWLVYRSAQGSTGFMKVKVAEDVKKSFVALAQKTANITPKKVYETGYGTDQPYWRFCSWLDRRSMRPKEFVVEGRVRNQAHDPSNSNWKPAKLPESVLDLYQAIVNFQDKAAQPWIPSDSDIQLIPKADRIAKTAHLARWPSGLSYTVRKRLQGDEHIRLKPDFSQPYKILELDRLLESQSKTGGYLVLNGKTYLASWVRVAKSLTPEQEKKELEYSKDPDEEMKEIKAEAEREKLSKPLRRNPKADVFASPTRISLSGPKSDFKLDELTKLPPPSDLAILCPEFSDQDLLTILNNDVWCKNLKSIELNGTNVTNAVMPKLATLARSKEFWQIDVSDTHVSWPGVVEFVHLAPDDSKCQVSFNFMGRQSNRFEPKETSYAPELHQIHVREDLRGVDLSKLSQLPVQALFVESPIHDQDLKNVAQLTNLQKIIFEDPLITDAGIQLLSTLTELKYLEIARNCASKISGATLPLFPNLEELYLNDSPVNSAGIKRIANLPKLQKLFINGTAVTDSDIAPLGAMKTLEWVALSDTKVTNGALDKLRKTVKSVEPWPSRH